MAKVPKKVLRWRERQRKGRIMRPSTFKRIEREARRRGATDPTAVAGAAYWKTVRAKFRRRNPQREPANEHIRNALAILLTARPLTDLDVKAVIARLRKALALIERVNIGLPNRGRGRSVRKNPALAVLGNPRVVDADLATWAKLEYMRPDDPDGRNVVRTHEFKDGFEIGWLDDGSVQLSHPRHPLWTDDGA